MRITQLNVYPLKGAAGISVGVWQLDGFGLRYDRRWMVVDGVGTFISQRSDAGLGQVRPSFAAGSLALHSGTSGECRLPLSGGGGAHARVRVWNDDVDAVDCGEEAAAFISVHLGREARLVHMPDSTLRAVDPSYAPPGVRVSFADAFPLLIIGEGSLAELNGRLGEPVAMKRFRPNVVVSDTAPHEEDSWRRVRLGDVECDVVKPCARCVVPNIDPDTAVASREPNRTLASYRRWDGHIWFGQNAIHHGPGTLVVGASVDVLDTGEPDPPLLL